MKKIKNIIIFFLMMFAFSFSFEDSKIELAPKRKEPAKLTIGVHKLKSKPLPMDFDKKNKLIYGEINITDDQVVYVSESLNEIPSLTTSSGRRVVNNIKKYLTRDIKEAPKFNYQVKTDEESGKKYLLIKCKAPLENVYVYVVEKGSYHVKEGYKGQFNLVDEYMNPDALEERYGPVIINQDENFTLKNNDIISFNGTSVIVNNKIIPEESWSVPDTKFPEKYYRSSGGFTSAQVKITLTSGTTGIDEDFTFKNDGRYDVTLPIKNGATTLNEKIRFYTEKKVDKSI